MGYQRTRVPRSEPATRSQGGLRPAPVTFGDLPLGAICFLWRLDTSWEPRTPLESGVHFSARILRSELNRPRIVPGTYLALSKGGCHQLASRGGGGAFSSVGTVSCVSDTAHPGADLNPPAASALRAWQIPACPRVVLPTPAPHGGEHDAGSPGAFRHLWRKSQGRVHGRES